MGTKDANGQACWMQTARFVICPATLPTSLDRNSVPTLSSASAALAPSNCHWSGRARDSVHASAAWANSSASV
jgi:hypothetical protein